MSFSVYDTKKRLSMVSTSTFNQLSYTEVGKKLCLNSVARCFISIKIICKKNFMVICISH